MSDARAWWDFAVARQTIWHRRVVMNDTPPWTTDPVLARYRFCNIQRELDYGTRVLREQVIPRSLGSAEECVYNTLAYRFINNADAWLTHLGPLDDSWGDRLQALREAKESPWTRAWMVPTLPSLPGRDIFARYAYAVRSWAPRVPAVVEACRQGDLERVHVAVQRLSGFGAFTGFQAALDMPYIFEALRGEDERWVYTLVKTGGAGGHNVPKNPAGSGYGALLIDPHASPLDTMKRLRDEQPTERWTPVADLTRPHLTLAAIEHGLCEWTKYLRLTAGVKTKMRLFEPRKEVLSSTRSS